MTTSKIISCRNRVVTARAVERLPALPDVLNSALIKYYAYIHTAINPDGNTDLISLNWGAGVDIASTLTLFGTRHNYFTGNNYDNITIKGLRSLTEDTFSGEIPKSLRMKYTLGWTPVYALLPPEGGYYSEHDRIFRNRPLKGIWLELKSLGVPFDSIDFDSYHGAPRISFRWDYFGLRSPERYSFTFIHVGDLIKTDSYPEQLNSVLRKGFDYFFQKAAMKMPEEYGYEEGYLHYVLPRLNMGGFSVSDDYAYYMDWCEDYSSAFPKGYTRSVDIPGIEPFKAYVADKMDIHTEDRRYGVYLNVRQRI